MITFLLQQLYSASQLYGRQPTGMKLPGEYQLHFSLLYTFRVLGIISNMLLPSSSGEQSRTPQYPLIFQSIYGTPLVNNSKRGDPFLLIEFIFSRTKCVFGILFLHYKERLFKLFYICLCISLRSFYSNRLPYGFFKRPLMFIIPLHIFSSILPSIPFPTLFNPLSSIAFLLYISVFYAPFLERFPFPKAP